jgi:hypothetical protein
MFDHAPRSPPSFIVWNDMTSSSCFSSRAPGHTSLETHSSGNQSRDLDTSMSPYAGGSNSGSPTPGNIFSTSSAEYGDMRMFESVSEAKFQPPKRTTVACRSCRKRKIKCERNTNVQRRKQRGRSAPLTHDQCHKAPSVSKLKLQEELDATKLALFRAEEKSKVMSAKIARLEDDKEQLEDDKKELLERLWHPSVRVSGCCAYLVHSDDLTPQQAISYIQHGIW